MNKSIVTILSVLLLSVNVFAQEEKTITLTESEYQSILNRLDQLEQKAQKVDAYSGASTPKPADNDSVAEQPQKKKKDYVHNRLTIGGYGEIAAKHCFYSNNYLRYVSPDLYKDQHFGEFDLPHFVLFLGYDFGKGWSMATEIEFEHGGVEAAKEIEEKEGGSEIEQEIERGGEVALEQFWLQKKFNDYAIIRAGMQIVPVGALNANHESNKYFGVYRPEGEYTILPSTWHEVALTFMGKTPFGLHYQAMFLPGLDSDRFNNKNWIKPGAGSPYEFKLATVFAGAARIDYTGVKGLRLSLSGYCGNSFRNSLSNKINGDQFKGVTGTVTVGSFDFAYDDYNVIIRGNATYGHLGNSQEITQYNSTGQISSKTRVASDAIAVGAELGYDFFSLSNSLHNNGHKFYLFGRYDWYDAMLMYNSTPSTKDAWCGRQRFACGINYYPIKQVGIKAEYSYSILKKGVNITYNDEPTIAIGIVYAGMFNF